MFEGKSVTVTGGTGMIGRFLVDTLVKKGARVRVASLDDPSRAHPKAEFLNVDLTRFENCKKACDGADFVFHLAGIKGSPMMTRTRPASFFYPTISFNTHMMEAARQAGAKRYLFTSTIGVYSPAEVFEEDSVWKTFPSENDKFAGWAKRMGELQAEAYQIEYDWKEISIVRPANVYGPYDNFDPKNAMVIPSLIKRAMDGENPLVVWGDGTQVRDFIHAQDVADGMILAMEKGESRPLNLGSGVGVTIREIVETIIKNMKNPPDVVWDTNKPTGDKKRLMDISRAESIGYRPKISIQEGVAGVMKWYEENKEQVNKRYNVFTK